MNLAREITMPTLQQSEAGWENSSMVSNLHQSIEPDCSSGKLKSSEITPQDWLQGDSYHGADVL